MSLPRKKLLISLHGIRTRGEWQKELCPIVSERKWKYYPLDYGKFLATPLALGFHGNKIDWFREQYNQIMAENPEALPSIIVHSFGSLILAKSLEKFPDLKFDKIILTGSIIPREYNWSKVRDRGQYSCVMNLIGGLDPWPNAISCSPFAKAGNSGTKGFLELNPTDNVQEIVYERGGHGIALKRDVFRTNVLEFLERTDNSNAPKGNYLTFVDPFEAACWSVITYLKQFVERFQLAKRSDDFHSRDGENYAKLKEPPKGLIILIPDKPSGASIDARDEVESKLNLKKIAFLKKSRSILLGEDGYAYDIPSVLASFQVYDESLGNSEASIKAVKDFAEIMIDAVATKYGDLEFAPQIKLLSQVIRENKKHV